MLQINICSNCCLWIVEENDQLYVHFSTILVKYLVSQGCCLDKCSALHNLTLWLFNFPEARKTGLSLKQPHLSNAWFCRSFWNTLVIFLVHSGPMLYLYLQLYCTCFHKYTVPDTNRRGISSMFSSAVSSIMSIRFFFNKPRYVLCIFLPFKAMFSSWFDNLEWASM